MKRIISIFIFLFIFICQISARDIPKNTIYLARTMYKDFDKEGLTKEQIVFMYMQNTGDSQITDIGNGYYLLQSAIGLDTISVRMYAPKIVNNQLIQFTCDTRDKELVKITPTDIYIMNDLVRLSVSQSILYEEPFEKLKNFLSGTKRTPGNSNGGTTGNRTTTSITGLPTSGSLSPATFALHPFGFMPSNIKSGAEALRLLEKAGWKAGLKNAASNSIEIESNSRFQIPFQLYGKKIQYMGAFPEVNIRAYWLTVSNPKTQWTQTEATSFATKIVNDLVAAGYSKSNNTEKDYYTISANSLSGNGLSISVSVKDTGDNSYTVVVKVIRK